jgi:PIN domain nuclease of toxin-antitoxin system
MKLLLDTHSFLWALDRSISKLLESETEAISNPDNIVCVSLATLWEIAIKSNIGKLTLPKNFFSDVETLGYEILNIETSHIRTYCNLPLIHRDPFDRMLIAQAKYEQLILITHDDEIKRYDIQVL